MSDASYERMVMLVLALLREKVFQCETIEQVEHMTSLIRGLEDADTSDEDVLPQALDLLAGYYEF